MKLSFIENRDDLMQDDFINKFLAPTDHIPVERFPVWSDRLSPDSNAPLQRISPAFGNSFFISAGVVDLPPQPPTGFALSVHVEAEELCQRSLELSDMMQDETITDIESVKTQALRLRAVTTRVLREVEELIDQSYEVIGGRSNVGRPQRPQAPQRPQRPQSPKRPVSPKRPSNGAAINPNGVNLESGRRGRPRKIRTA